MIKTCQTRRNIPRRRTFQDAINVQLVPTYRAKTLKQNAFNVQDGIIQPRKGHLSVNVSRLTKILCSSTDRAKTLRHIAFNVQDGTIRGAIQNYVDFFYNFKTDNRPHIKLGIHNI